MDMFINELVPLIDKRFEQQPVRRKELLPDSLWGGFGALSIASQHPETFSVSIGIKSLPKYR